MDEGMEKKMNFDELAELGKIDLEPVRGTSMNHDELVELAKVVNGAIKEFPNGRMSKRKEIILDIYVRAWNAKEQRWVVVRPTIAIKRTKKRTEWTIKL